MNITPKTAALFIAVAILAALAAYHTPIDFLKSPPAPTEPSPAQ